MENVRTNWGSFAISKLKGIIAKRFCFLAIIAVIGFSFSACIINLGDDNPFSGTTWSGEGLTLRFTSDTRWELSDGSSTINGTYTCNGSTATLTDRSNDTATAEISGSSLTFRYGNTTYYFTRGSGNGGGGGSKPSAPTGVTATAVSGGIRISWNSVSGATSYTVYWSSSSSGTYDVLETTSSTSYTDYDVNPGERYYYKVSASNSYGESSMSSAVSATAQGGSGEASVFSAIYRLSYQHLDEGRSAGL
jgi:hypothetical protein